MRPPGGRNRRPHAVAIFFVVVIVVTTSLALSPGAMSNVSLSSAGQPPDTSTLHSSPSPASTSITSEEPAQGRTASFRPSSPISQVLVGASPQSMTYDSGKGEVFVANANSNNVSVINDRTNVVVATISGIPQPVGITYDSGKGEIFVASFNSLREVSVINDSTNAIVATIIVGDWPDGVAYDPGKGEVFVTNSVSGNVSVINDTTNSVNASIWVNPYPQGIAYDGGKGELFVPCESLGISVISAATNTVVATIPVAGGPYGVAYDSGKGEVFVSSPGLDNVSVIDDTTNRVVANITAGFIPNGISYDGETGAVFVTNRDSNNLTVVDDRNNRVGATITLGVGTDPIGETYDTGVGEVFVGLTGDGTVPGTVDIIPGNLSAGATLLPFRASVDIGQPLVLNTTAIANPSDYSYSYSSPSSAGCATSTGPSITCTPNAESNFTVSVKITDAFGSIGNATSARVRVYSGLIPSATVSNATLWLGDSVFISGNATGGLPPYSYNFTGLPPGCVPQGTDQIGCLPTESGNYTIHFIVSDSNNWSASAARALSVTFDFIVLAPSNATVGSPVTLRVDSAPGIGTLSYTYANLPPGCANQDVATLTCTPTTVGIYSVVIGVHDQAGDHNTHAIVLDVVPAPKGSPGFLGLAGLEGYYLLAVIAGLTCVAIVAVSAVSRRKRLTAKAGKPQLQSYAGYRKAVEEPGAPGIEVLAEGEPDPASDLF